MWTRRVDMRVDMCVDTSTGRGTVHIAREAARVAHRTLKTCAQACARTCVRTYFRSLRQAEVGDLDFPRGVAQDVGQLEVAVQDVLAQLFSTASRSMPTANAEDPCRSEGPLETRPTEAFGGAALKTRVSLSAVAVGAPPKSCRKKNSVGSRCKMLFAHVKVRQRLEQRVRDVRDGGLAHRLGLGDHVEQRS